MDRFLIKTSIGYPGHDVSVDILKQVDITDRAQTISPVLSGDDVMRLRQVATEIYVDDAIREYIVRLLHAWRFGTDPMRPYLGRGRWPCLRGAG